jgi:HK97 family phage major capsid protein
MRSIILRKIAGKLQPLWQSSVGPSFSGGHRTGGSPLFASLFGMVLLTIVLVAATWLLSHTSFDPHALAIGGFGLAGITGDSSALAEKRQELSAKAALWEEADKLSTVDGKRDMSQKALLEKLGAVDAADAKGKVDALYFEIQELNQDIDDLHYKEMKSGVGSIRDELKKPIRQLVPSTHIGNEPNTFGQMVVDSPEYKARRRGEQMIVEVDVDMKTLLQTSAGWQPRTDNGTRVVDKIIRPVQLLDRIPTDTTELFEIPYMTETTRTQAAAEIAEAGTYQEDAFVLARSTSVVRKIGSQIPVTDEQLADVGSMRSFLDNRLRFGLEARLDQQILVGDGTPPNIQGVLTVSGIQTQPKGADSAPNAIFKALTLVRLTGRAIPDTIVMHGTDWQNVRISQFANGDYPFGPPTLGGADSMWGLPVVQSEALTAGNAIVGAFQTYSQLYYKKGVEVSVGFINTQFIEGKVTLRADLRAAFAIYRGAAFAKVTGL